MQDFHDKVVVITGAASGIGRAMAEAFAKEGARLVVADIDAQALEKEQQRLRDFGAVALAVQVDVADGASVESLARQTLDAYGAVHVVCNNAGVGQSLRATWEFSVEYWRWMLGVNLWGVIHGIRTFVPIMLDRLSEGHIVNTASVAGLVSYPVPYHAVYAATKHAVVSISESLHADSTRAKSKIKASVLCPGLVQTKIMDSARHRSGVLAAEGHTQDAVARTWTQQIESSANPADIAAQVLAGIRNEQLYILTHQELNDVIRAHAEDLVLQRNPAPPTV